MNKYVVIGLMSGTSLDGLDLCAVEFKTMNGVWEFDILKKKTINYTSEFKRKLEKSTQLKGLGLSLLNIELGEYFGIQTNSFIKNNNLTVDFIASHGHTVFHQPDKKLTLQLGCGQEIANQTQLPVVFDFRSKDVLLGGNGAPLVPIGDQLLFSDFDACINFGGIANISFSNENKKRIAFDICPYNMGLNYFANQLGLEFDGAGEIAKSGALNKDLLDKLNQLNYYQAKCPKSLGIEWFQDSFLPIFNDYDCILEDKLCTISHHISFQISKVLMQFTGNKILVTGGGVYNDFIIDLIQINSKKILTIPSKEIIDFKEALIFALLGVLKWENKINVLKSVTGASKNTSSGVIVLP